eukprot:1077144-Pyramimonas_sp.AAC.1
MINGSAEVTGLGLGQCPRGEESIFLMWEPITGGKKAHRHFAPRLCRIQRRRSVTGDCRLPPVSYPAVDARVFTACP